TRDESAAAMESPKSLTLACSIDLHIPQAFCAPALTDHPHKRVPLPATHHRQRIGSFQMSVAGWNLCASLYPPQTSREVRARFCPCDSWVRCVRAMERLESLSVEERALISLYRLTFRFAFRGEGLHLGSDPPVWAK